VKTRRASARRTGEAQAVRSAALAAAIGLVLAGRGAAAATLPVPCASSNCGASGPTSLVGNGVASVAVKGNTATINQTSNNAVLNWASFNISADGKVVFTQPNSSSIALNRIFQGSASTILGSLSSNGQIYLLNPNGILFGAGSQVNVGGLLASSLGISDATFQAGIVSPQLLAQGQAALVGDGRTSVLDQNGNPVLGPNGQPLPVAVTVAPGAQISTASGGRVLLAAPAVENGGTISTPDGQTILAAGQRVYLQASTDPSLRGLLVEVDLGGAVLNDATGSISVGAGNATLIGLAVNQNGRVSATTTVNENGSIRLLAEDTAHLAGLSAPISATRFGTLSMGPGSVTEVLPDYADQATAVAEQTQLRSSVQLVGQQILLNDADVTVTGGTLTATATQNTSGLPGTDLSAPRIRIDGDSTIDLSGAWAELPMSANLVSVQLRGTELADDPDQRNGALRGQTVIVDARVGTPIANVSGELAAMPQTIAQRLSAGGTATFAIVDPLTQPGQQSTAGDIVVASTATINVSGGGIRYDGGLVATTQLVAVGGQTYDIGSASPTLTYTGVLNPTYTVSYNSWGVQQILPTPGTGHYEPGYVQGSPAGGISFAAPQMVLNGTLLGTAVDGPYQRTPATFNPGGSLQIGVAGSLATGSFPDFLAPSVTFVDHPPALAIADTTPLNGPLTLDLPTDLFTSGGFTNTSIYSNGSITLPAGLALTLLPGGRLNLYAGDVSLLSSITAPGGALRAESVGSVLTPSTGLAGALTVGSDVTFDVRGLWTNDETLPVGSVPSGATALNGGSITLLSTVQGGAITIGDDVNLRASGGAWLSATGKLTAGGGGSITIQDSVYPSTLSVGQDLSLDAFGVLGAKGGSFTLGANALAIDNAPAGSTSDLPAQSSNPFAGGAPFDVYGSLFSRDGFQSFTLLATGPISATPNGDLLLNIEPNTQINAYVSTLPLSVGYRLLPSGSPLALASPVLWPEYRRSPASISFIYDPIDWFITGLGPDFNRMGTVSVGAGALIATDPLGAVAIQSNGSVVIDGTIRSPGGTVALSVPPSPSDSVDSGYFPDQRVEIGSGALIDVSGILVEQPGSAGFNVGSVLPGGSVSLIAGRGSVVVDAGATVDLAGTQGRVEVPQANGTFIPETVASAGGSLTVFAVDSLALLGKLEAAPGTGATGPAAGGSLSLTLTQDDLQASLANSFTFPTIETTLVVESDAQTEAPPLASGLGLLSAPQIAAAGFDALRLSAGNSVAFAPFVSLNLNRELVIDSPVVAIAGTGTVNLSAPYVAIGNSLEGALTSPPAATGGGGTLNVRANAAELYGQLAFDGIGLADIQASGDLRLRGTIVPPPSATVASFGGSLSFGGDLSLGAARIYPSTATSYAIAAADPNGNVTIAQTGVSPGIPLSAGGSLTISAANISSTGTLVAPFGSIALNASDTLTLGSGSVTSVSAAGTVVPYGITLFSGLEWIYETSEVNIPITGVPTRQVTLNAPKVNFASGATVDVRGGGDLYAYEWVPGPGGTSDALNVALSGAQGLYAILPGLAGQLAPFDPQESAGFGLPIGTSVYLSGLPGLPAGYYPLLPARYGLLPGAMLIQEVAGLPNIAPGHAGQLADGTPVVAGYDTFLNTGLGGTAWNGFAVYGSGQARSLAQYLDTVGSSFFPAVAAAVDAPRPMLPADAGSLAISVATSLVANGKVLTTPATGGLAGEVDLSATQLEITAGSQPPAASGAVQVSTGEIEGWSVGRLLLGGATQADGSIEVSATTVTVDSGVSLTANEVILVAGQTISVASGATVASTSAAGGAAPSTPLDAQNVQLTGANAAGAAFVAVSDRDLLLPTRPNAPATAATIDIASGASLASRGAITVDGLGAVALDGSLQANGTRIALGAGEISFAAGVQAPANGLSISTALAAELENAASLRLASGSSIEFGDTFSLTLSPATPPPGGSALTISAATLSLAPGVAVNLTAPTVTLESPGAESAAPVAGTGTLAIHAGTLTLGPGTVTATGVANALLGASAQIVGEGSGGLSLAANLTIDTPLLTASSGAVTDIAATGASLLITNSAGTTARGSSADIGGSLSLAAGTITQNGTMSVPSGTIALEAATALSLGGHSVTDTGGVTLVLGPQTLGSPGGNISISSAGTALLASGAQVSVAGAGDQAAGTVSLQAAGAATVNATFAGSGGAGANGGSFVIEAGSLPGGLTPLNTLLETGGFTNTRDVRVLSGDLTLAAGAVANANQQIYTADTGLVDIAGTLNAPDAGQRGVIELFGGVGVTLGSTAQLHADGGTRGGSIELATSAGSLNLMPGSVVTATGTTSDGDLRLRAPAIVASSDVAIGTLGANVSGLAQVIVEPVLVTPVSGTLADADFANLQGAVASYMASAPTVIGARLAPGGATPLVVEPGVEFDATGNLTINSTQDLSSWRFAGAPVALSVRASGALTLNGGFSDGFGPANYNGSDYTGLLPGNSAPLSFVAGADLSSANPYATVAGSNAALDLGSGTVLRTGTGNLSLVASGNINFATGAQAYTAGVDALASFAVASPSRTVAFNLPTDGGNLSIVAGGNISAPPATQDVSIWQSRIGNATSAAQWGTNFDALAWTAGTFGGGDVTVRAGGAITELSIASADSLGIGATGGTVYTPAGGMVLAAGGDIASIQLFAGSGRASVTSGGSISQYRAGVAGSPVGSLFAMGDAQLSVTAVGDVHVAGVYDPTAMLGSGFVPPALRGQFFDYGADASFSAESLSGTVSLETDPTQLKTFIGTNLANIDSRPGAAPLLVLPGSVNLRSLAGNVSVAAANLWLYPTTAGQLTLFAGNDIQGVPGGSIAMADVPTGGVPTVQNPAGTIAQIFRPFSAGAHAGNPQPVMVVAGEDIVNFGLDSPKPAQIVAGRDIVNLSFVGQNLASTDTTVVEAGRDINYQPSAIGAGITVGGPGDVDVLAGRNLNLGFSTGITTVGDYVNANLPVPGGANLTLMAGLSSGSAASAYAGPDYTGFVRSVVLGNATLAQELQSFVAGATGDAELSASQAATAFATLPSTEQAQFVLPLYFDQLIASGRSVASGQSTSYAEGYAAIDALFPGSRGATNPYAGDITLPFSRIYTLNGGTISILAPGGLLNVGLAQPPTSLGVVRQPSQLGIVAEGPGDVDIYTFSNVLVNSSRVFTLDGGNIAIWSTVGNIDAGRGAKTAISAPPPQILVTASGAITTVFAGAVAGSGIRTIITEPGVTGGDVDLIAPAGFVNAGDAGIGAAGNISIAALQVIGASNINFGGTATGVPAAVSGLGASLSSASTAGAGATTAATSAASEEAGRSANAPLAASALSWLDAFVVGLGEDVCRPDDLECLKRQKH
jgi:filamentous hemagglutinin